MLTLKILDHTTREGLGIGNWEEITMLELESMCCFEPLQKGVILDSMHALSKIPGGSSVSHDYHPCAAVFCLPLPPSHFFFFTR